MIQINALMVGVTFAPGVVSTYAGSGVAGGLDGIGTVASFYHPNGLCANSAGTLFVADYTSHRIRQIASSGLPRIVCSA